MQFFENANDDKQRICLQMRLNNRLFDRKETDHILNFKRLQAHTNDTIYTTERRRLTPKKQFKAQAPGDHEDTLFPDFTDE